MAHEDDIEGTAYPLPGLCDGCGEIDGVIRMSTIGQVGLYCGACGRWAKWLSKQDVGLKPRTVASRPGITAAMRARVMHRCSHRCFVCGRSAADGVQLEVDHMLQRSDAEAHGCLDALIDSEPNYTTLCKECNLGRRSLKSSDATTLLFRSMQMGGAA